MRSARSCARSSTTSSTGSSTTGEADIATDFCEPYPIPIICELFGAPQEDLQLFSDWATDIFRIFNGNLAEDKATIIRAQDELDAYVGDLIERRREHPVGRPHLGDDPSGVRRRPTRPTPSW